MNAYEKLKKMSNDHLITVFETLKMYPSLKDCSWDDPGPYDCETMEVWYELVKREIETRRLIKTYGELSSLEDLKEHDGERTW